MHINGISFRFRYYTYSDITLSTVSIVYLHLGCDIEYLMSSPNTTTPRGAAVLSVEGEAAIRTYTSQTLPPSSVVCDVSLWCARAGRRRCTLAYSKVWLSPFARPLVP